LRNLRCGSDWQENRSDFGDGALVETQVPEARPGAPGSSTPCQSISLKLYPFGG
jgi:hypothetical protein